VVQVPSQWYAALCLQWHRLRSRVPLTTVLLALVLLTRTDVVISACQYWPGVQCCLSAIAEVLSSALTNQSVVCAVLYLTRPVAEVWMSKRRFSVDDDGDGGCSLSGGFVSARSLMQSADRRGVCEPVGAAAFTAVGRRGGAVAGGDTDGGSGGVASECVDPSEQWWRSLLTAFASQPVCFGDATGLPVVNASLWASVLTLVADMAKWIVTDPLLMQVTSPLLHALCDFMSH
jgi:hypothetical protein